MAMHFGMYFTHKNTTYGAMQVLRTRMGVGVGYTGQRKLALRRSMGANVISVTRDWSSQLSRKSC